ncbi:hypothetical protein ACTFIZ_006215 [Dictyostelium cf. discoideum]
MNDNDNEENENGAELRPIKKDNEIESLSINPDQYEANYKLDFKISLILLLVGLITWIPFVFNINYIRSQNVHARRMSVVSIVFASSYFAVGFILSANVISMNNYNRKNSYYNYYN